MRRVKKRAAETGRTMTSLVETALRDLLAREKRPDNSYKLRWITTKGSVQPGVDVADRDSLYDSTRTLPGLKSCRPGILGKPRTFSL